MATAVLRVATPTPFERALQRIARGLIRHVEKRIAARADRRAIALDLLREQQARKADLREVDHALAWMGVPRR
jgi:hypothetical protein